MMHHEDLSQMLINLEVDDIADRVEEKLSNGAEPQEILEALTRGMNEVGRLYEENEYFLPELVLAGETMKEAFKVLKPYLKVGDASESSAIITATVQGDTHDIGKNILITMLLSGGFEVIDLGTDCSADTIVQSVREHKARVVALSALLTTTMREISNVNQALKEAGLRDSIKLIVGGAPLSENLAKELGADAYGADAIEGVRKIRSLLEE
ncbi:MAG: corrinoid protein [Candidatus Thorarchaeota archaeon]|nr:corrinoid protein [Candidatus Thorarchaeota archaeon]